MRGGPAWFIWIETLGIVSFAVNAMIVAHPRGVSALGVFFCAAATALGGGTVRDVLLGPQALPFFWAAHPAYIVAIFCLSVLYAKLPAVRRVIARRDVLIKEGAEAAALASLGALGAAKTFTLLGPGDGGALSAAHLLILCAALGAVSAAFGSVIRDTILNEFPSVLRPGVGTLEALFLGCALLAALRLAGVAPARALLPAFLAIFTIRVLAVMDARRASAAP